MQIIFFIPVKLKLLFYNLFFLPFKFLSFIIIIILQYVNFAGYSIVLYYYCIIV
jgi:hypothetical protein